jgi:hypothetical protein
MRPTRHKSFGFLLFMLILGMIIGTAVGEAIGHIVPDGVVKSFFLAAADPSFGPVTVNLVAFTFTFGFSLKINLIAVLGVFATVYLFRWY